MLNSHEFIRLQKLSCLSLSSEETELLGNQLSLIVSFLGLLNTLSIDEDILSQEFSSDFDHDLPLSQDMIHYEDMDALFVNTKHEIINRSIIIKSVVE